METIPASAEYFVLRSDTLAENGDHEKALAEYTHAISIDPTDAESLSDRCACFAEVGKYYQAIADITQIIKLNPNNATGYCHRAGLYEKSGNTDKDIADYNEVNRLDPRYFSTDRNGPNIDSDIVAVFRMAIEKIESLLQKHKE